MKKISLLVSVVLLLAACGEERTESNETQNAQPSEEQVSTEEPVEEPEFTEDPLEIGNKNSGYDLFLLDGYTEYKVVGYYSTNETDENGFNSVSFKGYDFTFSVLAVEDTATGDQYIATAGETENNTEDNVQFNVDMIIVTDTQDQTNNEGAIGESQPNVKQKGFILAPLTYGIPESFTLTLDPPFKSIGDYQYEEGHYGEPIEFSFTKD